MTQILLIDDDHALGQIVGDFLTTAGYTIAVREETKGIYDFISASKPHLIILDYFLPDNDGLTIARNLKKNPATGDIPIIMMSSSYGIELRARECGVETFIPKPFNIDVLLTAIRKFPGI